MNTHVLTTNLLANLFLYEMLKAGSWPELGVLPVRTDVDSCSVQHDPESGLSVRVSVDPPDVDFEIVIGPLLLGAQVFAVRAYNLDASEPITSLGDYSERVIIPAVIGLRAAMESKKKR